MIYSWRYPESIHRSVMIGVNPPGNFLWDAEDDRRADRSVRRALLRTTTTCREGHRRPRRVDQADNRRDSRRLVVPADQGGQRASSAPSRARWRRPRTSAGRSRAVTIDTLARRDRATMRAGSGSLSTPGRSSPRAQGFVWGESPPPRRIDAADGGRLLLRDRAGSGSRTRQPRHGVRLWPVAGWAIVAGEHRTRTSTAVCGRRRWRRSSSAAGSTSRRRPQTATRELLPHLSNGHQVVLPGSATRTTSGRTNRKRAPG